MQNSDERYCLFACVGHEGKKQSTSSQNTGNFSLPWPCATLQLSDKHQCCFSRPILPSFLHAHQCVKVWVRSTLVLMLEVLWLKWPSFIYAFLVLHKPAHRHTTLHCTSPPRTRGREMYKIHANHFGDYTPNFQWLIVLKILIVDAFGDNSTTSLPFRPDWSLRWSPNYLKAIWGKTPTSALLKKHHMERSLCTNG